MAYLQKNLTEYKKNQSGYSISLILIIIIVIFSISGAVYWHWKISREKTEAPKTVLSEEIISHPNFKDWIGKIQLKISDLAIESFVKKEELNLVEEGTIPPFWTDGINEEYLTEPMIAARKERFMGPCKRIYSPDNSKLIFFYDNYSDVIGYILDLKNQKTGSFVYVGGRCDLPVFWLDNSRFIIIDEVDKWSSEEEKYTALTILLSEYSLKNNSVIYYETPYLSLAYPLSFDEISQEFWWELK